MKRLCCIALLVITASCKKETETVAENQQPARIPDSIANKIRKTVKEGERYADSILPKKYVFIRLSVSEQPITGIERLNVVSKIVETRDVSDEQKAKMEDLMISNYLNSTSAQVYNGRIISKETFVFDTYMDASSKRNTFLVEEE
ncbi:TPA: hypothetical protein L3261_001750 [Elizabethkingia anophelis]|nr:hypothetical protein [Elizabethkingia anophelis]MDV3687983.1 hypothetical protein [Elizabethkingia anophelis]MDV3785409.1 hypothetical protein [Elizabethkingia anophelis]MDV3810247.1 hypothetical protein [Elizabethkingia anophelis]MDV3817455.1 hypothetical protein [Elizabethkingia anophelis]